MFEPTEEQTVFLIAEGKTVLCACPGSGKTFVVAKKLLKYLDNWTNAYSGVAVLSFTNVASEEIRRQAQEASGEKIYNLGFPHFIGTLDSFIDSFIFLRFGYLMQPQNRKRPRVMFGNIGTIHVRERECHQKGCADTIDLFHWTNKGLLREGKQIDCSVKIKPCIALKKSMLANGLFTQKEVTPLALRLLEKHKSIADAIAVRFPVIIVDEAQDTSVEQMAILDILVQAGVKTMLLVGDPDQSIYEWRDAIPAGFVNKMTDANWTTLKLTDNFRSSQHICNATKCFSNMLAYGDANNAKSDDKNYSVKPVLLQVENIKNNLQKVKNYFTDQCKNNKIDINKTAILTRNTIHGDEADIKNLWKTKITEWFAKATYEWDKGQKRKAFDYCEIALFLLRGGADDKVSKEDIKASVEYENDYSVWKKQVIEVLSILPSSDSAIKAWRQNLIVRLIAIVDSGKIVITGKLEDTIKIKSRNMDSSKKYSTEFLDMPLYVFFEKKAIGIRTESSVHGVKGETYDAVLLIVKSTTGRNALTPNILTKGNLNNELIRIAYVAMTRPKKLLVVAIQKQKNDNELNRFPIALWDYKYINETMEQ